MAQRRFTIGIEEEYQIIHPDTRELTSYIQEFLDEGRVILKDQIKPEFLQSQVEVGSRICENIQGVREEIIRLRKEVSRLAESKNLRVAAAGTHPFTSWTTQEITSGERYTKHAENMADVARQMLVFGMHVHVGIDDPDVMIDVMNQSRYFLPHMLALSASSPFWAGRDTGLKSYRTIILNSLPRAGLPPSFRSRAEYAIFVDTLVRTGCIDEPTKIWWDIRPNPKFPTLEFRFADICTRIDEAVCIAAMVVALVAKLIRLRESNVSWREYRRNLITENKWRAARYGIGGKLIDFGKREEFPVGDLVQEFYTFVDDVVDDLGLRKDVHYANTILEGGNSADRQLDVYKQGHDLRAVVDHVIAETKQGID